MRKQEHKKMIKLLKKIFSCWFIGFHDWTCKAEEGIQPTKEEAESIKGFWSYATMYCKRCNKVSDLSKKAIEECSE